MTSLATRAWMGEHGGVPVDTACIGGMGFEANLGLHSASNAELTHVTKQLALELTPQVRVNAVAPGVVRTKPAEARWEEQDSQLNSATALARIGEPEDVGTAIAFLVSDAASWATGETFVLEGGHRFGDAGLFRVGGLVHA